MNWRQTLTGFGLGLALPIGALLAIELLSTHGVFNPALIPPPSAVGIRLVQLVPTRAAVEAILHTLRLMAAGYATGCVGGILSGLLMGSSRSAYNLFEPIVELVRPIPKPALLPPLVLLLGLGSTLEITIVALGAFFPVLINTLQGVRAVDPIMLDMASTFGHGRAAIWRNILLPASAPFIITGMRISLGIAFVLVITAEMLAGNGGLGDVILSAQRSFLAKDSFSWLVVVAIIGFALTSLFNVVERRLVFWTNRERESAS